MNKQVLKSIIKECIDEIIRESQTAPNSQLVNRLKTNAALKKFPFADRDAVETYINANIDKNVTLRQLEIDANENKWDTDTTKAIYYLLSRKKIKDITQ